MSFDDRLTAGCITSLRTLELFGHPGRIRTFTTPSLTDRATVKHHGELKCPLHLSDLRVVQVTLLLKAKAVKGPQ